MSSFVRWTVRWGETVLATGTGPIPAEYGLPQPRVSHGDRAVVRNGMLTAEAVLAQRPLRVPRWSLPDLHFAKVFCICVMTLAAIMVLLRERAEELKVERPEVETDIFTPRLARWSGGHQGFTTAAASHAHAAPIPAKDLARIRGFKDKLQRRERERALAEAMSFGMIGLLGSSSKSSGVFASISMREEAGIEGGVPGGVLGGLTGSAAIGDSFGAGGLGLSGAGEGGGGRGEGIGLGSIGTIGHGAGTGSGTGYGRGMGGIGGLGSSRLRLRSVSGDARRVFARVRSLVEYCLEGYEGEVTTDVELFGDGRVKSVAVSGPDDKAQKCVARHLERQTFPAGEDHVSARWTIE